MLAAGELGALFRQGVVRLLPKVVGVPTAAQQRLITLLWMDCKLLMKMITARLLVVLPSVLLSTQMCSVRGRSIFDGGGGAAFLSAAVMSAAVLSAAVLSAAVRWAAEFLRRHERPGFLLSLDFFHVFDRVYLA